MYKIELTNSAAKEYLRLPNNVKDHIETAIDKLQSDPKPYNVKKLEDKENIYRIRIGHYRVIYEIDYKFNNFNYKNKT